MDNWQASTLSWSFSQKTHFDSCRRHYFLNRFWGQDPKLRWKLFEMRNITTLAMLRGQVVHLVIADALKRLRHGMNVDAEVVKRNITAVIREKYAESAKRLWHIDNRPQGRRPSSITNLLEHYYHFPNIDERAREAQQIAWQCVENLVSSEFWTDIAASDYSTWMEFDGDGFPSFDLDGIKVYSIIDFAHSNGSPTIIDWKTGASAEQDRRQLTLYSLYAQAKWEWDPLETTLCAVYLQPELVIESFRPTGEEIEAVKNEVKSSFNEMLALEPAYGPANPSDFPKTGAPNECGCCRFQGICNRVKQTLQ